MRRARLVKRCRWVHVNGPSIDGRHDRTLVWRCEYPYPTTRSTPCDCAQPETRRSTSAAEPLALLAAPALVQ